MNKKNVFYVILFVSFLTIFSCKDIKYNKENSLRIVSLAPSITGILEEILPDPEMIVGITDYCVIESESAIRVGGFNNFNLELIASCSPTHVFCLDSTSYEVYQNLISVFGDDTVYSFVHPESFEVLFEQIKLIGEKVGRVDRSIEFVDLQQQAITEIVKTISYKDSPRLLVELYYPPYYTVGSNTLISDIINLAHAQNAIVTETPWPVISLEQLYLTNPDVILRLNHGETADALKDFPVYKKGNIFKPFDQESFLQPGVKSVSALAELVDFLNKESLYEIR